MVTEHCSTSAGRPASSPTRLPGVSTCVRPLSIPLRSRRREAQALGLETIEGLIERIDLGERRFDMVMLCQTVDHLLDVTGTLAPCARAADRSRDCCSSISSISARPICATGRLKRQSRSTIRIT